MLINKLMLIIWCICILCKSVSHFVILFCWIWSVTHEGFNVCSVQAWLEFAQNRAEPHRQHQQNSYKFSLLWNIYMWQKIGPDGNIKEYNGKWKKALLNNKVCQCHTYALCCIAISHRSPHVNFRVIIGF